MVLSPHCGIESLLVLGTIRTMFYNAEDDRASNVKNLSSGLICAKNLLYQYSPYISNQINSFSFQHQLMGKRNSYILDILRSFLSICWLFAHILFFISGICFEPFVFISMLYCFNYNNCVVYFEIKKCDTSCFALH